QTPRKFCRALYQIQSHSVLEQLAYDAHPMDSILLLQPVQPLDSRLQIHPCIDHATDRSTSDNAADRFVAWRDSQLYSLGCMAWIGALPPEPLERFCQNALRYKQFTPAICHANFWRTAHLSLRCTRVGVFRLERSVPFAAGVEDVI